MSSANLWDHEEPVTDLGIDVPRWIAQDIDPATIAAITQGGCESGAYMPAVTYHQALATMSEYGDDVFDFIENQTGEAPPWPTVDQRQTLSWSGLACYWLSYAVALWAASVEEEVSDALGGRAEEAKAE